MNREVHVRFWESPEVKVLRATRQIRPYQAHCGGAWVRPVYPRKLTRPIGQAIYAGVHRIDRGIEARRKFVLPESRGASLTAP